MSILNSIIKEITDLNWTQCHVSCDSIGNSMKWGRVLLAPLVCLCLCVLVCLGGLASLDRGSFFPWARDFASIGRAGGPWTSVLGSELGPFLGICTARGTVLSG